MNGFQPSGSLNARGLPQYLDKPGAFFVEHGHLLPEGRDWRDVLRPDYWFGVIKYLDAGHQILVHSSDHSIRLKVLVLSCNSVAQPPILDLGFSAVWPIDLQLPPRPAARAIAPGLMRRAGTGACGRRVARSL